MKKHYHIIITADEKDNIVNAFATLGIEPQHTVINTNEFNIKRYEYIIWLSKYELLYVRLACKTGRVIEIGGKKQDEAETDKSVAPA